MKPCKVILIVNEKMYNCLWPLENCQNIKISDGLVKAQENEKSK